MDSSLYASFFPPVSGKQCVVYKCVVEDGVERFDEWLSEACDSHGHSAYTFVGAASSANSIQGLSLQAAGERAKLKGGCAFGCVCIPERHTKKGNEDINMMKKMDFGAEWFITQGIFSAEPLIKLINDYGELCKKHNRTAKKVVLTFAPCGRPKTMTFIKWLGMDVPADVEARIFAAENPVNESVVLLVQILERILDQTGGSGVPLGINVESLSIFKEEINAAHELFQRLQVKEQTPSNIFFYLTSDKFSCSMLMP